MSTFAVPKTPFSVLRMYGAYERGRSDIMLDATMLGDLMLQRPEKRLGSPATVLAFASSKGGGGKTRGVLELANWLALRGYAVLAIEVEYNISLTYLLTGRGGRGQQRIENNTTTWALFTQPQLTPGIDPFKVYLRKAVAEQIPSLSKHGVQTLIRDRDWHPTTLHFIPGSVSLAEMDKSFIMATVADYAVNFHQDVQLAKAIETLRHRYDFIILDTPPMIGLVQRNAIGASDEIVIVGTFDTDSINDIDMIDQFILTVKDGARQLGRRPPHVLGVVLNKMRANERDRRMLSRYTDRHPEESDDGEPTGRIEEAWLRYPCLGTIGFDVEGVIDEASDHRRSMHIWAPTGPIGRDLATVCSTIEQLLVRVPAHADNAGTAR
jgi:cellulose biosynthesis protein BcsQ